MIYHSVIDHPSLTREGAFDLPGAALPPDPLAHAGVHPG